MASVHSTVHYGQRGGVETRVNMLLSMESIGQNEKRPELLQETSGTMIFKARSQIFFGISKKKFDSP